MTNWNRRITEAREARGMTKADLMRACGVKAPTVTGWESGDIKTLEAGNLLKICDALRVDPWWLMLGKGKFKAEITEGKRPLSNEAKKLVLWVERMDGLGDPALKILSYVAAALQVAESIGQAQDSDVVSELEEHDRILSPHAETKGAVKHASKKHK